MRVPPKILAFEVVEIAKNTSLEEWKTFRSNHGIGHAGQGIWLTAWRIGICLRVSIDSDIFIVRMRMIRITVI